jgi:hypothetical protein
MVSAVTSGPGPLPTFLIIGAQKAGTRWLRANLGQHPDIFTVSEELWFFNNVGERFDVRGEKWYRRRFSGWAGEPAIGEATPGYMMFKHEPATVAERIQQVIPDVRLIAVLRNPVDRAQSAMIHHIKRGRFPADSRLVDLVASAPPEQEMKNLIAGGWYAASLRPYLDRFGPQLLVVLNDDIASDADGLYQQAVRHVGATPGFIPKGLDEVKFSNQPRDPKRRQALSADDRVALYRYFRDDIAELEVMIDRDLSGWDPTFDRAPTRGKGS